MKTISSDHVVYSMSKNHSPAAWVSSGDLLTFQTFDCFSEQICTQDDRFHKIGWDRINPATGPVHVDEAEPGDMLAVKILDIRVAKQGVMVTVPQMGLLGSHFCESTTKIIPVHSGTASFCDGIELPIDPMIGVIGTAPEKDNIPCGTPGLHGGNMDCKKIKKGATIYLPVFHPGGLLALGDLHALMGDGEILICGIEISGEVDVQVDVIKNTTWPLPMLEDRKKWMTIASAPTLDEACKTATENMAAWLTQIQHMTVEDAGMLMSTVGNLRICQVVDPLMTARFEFPKKYLRSEISS